MRKAIACASLLLVAFAVMSIPDFSSANFRYAGMHRATNAYFEFEKQHYAEKGYDDMLVPIRVQDMRHFIDVYNAKRSQRDHARTLAYLLCALTATMAIILLLTPASPKAAAPKPTSTPADQPPPLP